MSAIQKVDKVGAEFLVNTTTPGNQYEPAVASLSNGGFVVTWRDDSQTGDDTSSSAVRGQVFLADGSKSGGEFLVNTTTQGSQSYPSVASLGDGGFVVTWTDGSQTGGDTSGTAVRGQMFLADGSKSGGEFLVNTTTTGGQLTPAVASLSSGGFVVTWRDMSASGGDTSGEAVRGQVFASDGSKSGGEFLVNTTTSGNQLEPSVASLSGGGFVITWRDESATGDDTSSRAVRGQVFASNGSKSGGEFLVNTTTLGAQYSPAVASLSNGGFVVTWRDNSQTGDDTSGNAVRGQAFASDGSKSGAEFLVNTTTSGDQYDPAVVSLDNGGFVVAWSDTSATGGDTSGQAVRGQVFLDDGSKSGGEFLVNTTTSNSQLEPSVASLNDGGFVVTWTDMSATGDDTSGWAVRGQVFIHSENLFIGTAGPDTITGTAGADTISGGDGADLLIGGGGTDTISGGAGDDTISVTSSGTYDGGAGTDVLALGAAGGLDLSASALSNLESLSFNAGGSQVALTAAQINGFASFVGTDDQTNTITLAAPGAIDLSGKTLTNLSAVIGSAGDDSITGTAGAELISGGDGADLLVGGGGTDTISGGAGDDTISVTSSGTYDGGAGADVLALGAAGGLDLSASTLSNLVTLSFNAGGSQVALTAAQINGFGSFVGTAGRTNAITLAAPGSIDLSGKTLTNLSGVIGSAGDDTITAGGGADTLTGGGGNDDFVGTAAALAGDTITDFAIGDRIVIQGLDLSALNGQAAAGTIDLGGGQTLTLSGVTGASGSFAASFSGGNTVVTLVAPAPGGGDGGGGGSGSGGNSGGGAATTTVTVPAPSGDEGAPTQIASTATLTPPPGVSVAAEGPSSPQSTLDAANEVTMRVNAVVSSPADQALIRSNLDGFLKGRGAGTLIEIRTITPSAEPGAAAGAPIVITSSGGVGAGTEEAFVIDARGLPAGSVIQLDYVEFAVVVGDVTLIGGAGANYVIGDAGNQTIVLGEDDDTLFGGAGDDSIGSAGGSDWIYGGEGQDTVFGGAGQDFVYGNQGDDVVYGNQGDDFLFGGQGADILYGGQDADIAYGNLGDDVVYGNLGSDVLYGGQGDDVLYGGRGADTLHGGVGDDVLYGGEGDDRLFGGAGADRFVVAAGGGIDVIGDFDRAEGDRVLIQANIAGNGVDSFSALLGRATDNAVGDVDIQLAEGQIIRLVGVRTADLSAEMFGFF